MSGDNNTCRSATTDNQRCRAASCANSIYCRPHLDIATKHLGAEVPHKRTDEAALAVPAAPYALYQGRGTKTPEDVPELAQPDTIRRDNPTKLFRVLKEVGRGGYGHVFMAVRLIDYRIVAVKVLALKGSRDRLRRRLREVRLWAEVADCRHDNPDCALVPLYDAFYTAQYKELWIVMEYVEAGSLRQQIEQTAALATLAERNDVIERLCRQFLPVLETINRMHAKQVLHRDVNPTNLLCDESSARPRILIADLGVGCRGVECDKAIGSASYVEPAMELDHKPNDVDSEMYMIGVTLYELVTLKRCFNESLRTSSIVPTRQLYIRQYRENLEVVRACLARLPVASMSYVMAA